MYGIPKQGLNPDYKPDDQSRVVVAPSDAGPLPASESFCKHDCQHAFDCNGSCQGHFSGAVAYQLHNPFFCWDCE